MYSSLQNKIIDITYEMVCKYGIRCVTMDNVASKVGISKRTLYENFADKNTLMISCLRESDKKCKADFYSNINPDANAMELFMQYYLYTVNIIRKVSPAFFKDIERLYTLVGDEYELRHKETLNTIIQLLTKGIEEGYIRPDIKVDIIASAFSLQMKFISEGESNFPTGYSYIDIFTQIFYTFLRGVVTPKGMEEIDNFAEKNKLL